MVDKLSIFNNCVVMFLNNNVKMIEEMWKICFFFKVEFKSVKKINVFAVINVNKIFCFNFFFVW